MTATAAPESIVLETQADKLAKETVVLQLEISTPSFRTKIDSRTVMKKQDEKDESDFVDSNYIHTSKDLIDTSSVAFRAITGHASRFRTRWLRNRTIPCTMLKAGMVLVPVGNLDEIDRGLQQFKLERQEFVKAFAAVFEECKDAAKKRLGPQYDSEDYPSIEELQYKFSIKYRFWGFNVPAAIEKVNNEMWERERSRVEADWKSAAEEIQQAMREAFAGLVDHMVSRLQPDADGKPKTFKNAPIENLRDFLGTFATRNLTGDEELAGLVAKAKAIMGGVKPELLRKQDTTRDRVRDGFEQIKQHLDKLVVTKGRVFTWDDDA